MDKNFWADLAKSAIPYLIVVGVTVAGTWLWRDGVWRARVHSAPAETTYTPVDVGPFLITIDSLRGRLDEERVAYYEIAGDKEAAVRFYEAELARWRNMGVRETVTVRAAVLDTTVTTFQWTSSGNKAADTARRYTDTLRLKYLFPPVDRWTDIRLGLQKRHLEVGYREVTKEVPIEIEVKPPIWKEGMVVVGAGAIGYGAASKNWKVATGGLVLVGARYLLRELE